jgi:glycosyltransferase involved in cell wall biosynthesis
MKKYLVGVIGHFSSGNSAANGQTIKTRIMYEALLNKYGDDAIVLCDTYRWKRNPIKLLVNCIKIAKYSKNVIILPAHNGVKVFVPLMYLLRFVFVYKIHYVVIGAWLNGLLTQHKIIKSMLKTYDGIFVETLTSQKDLKETGLENIYLIPNFKYFTITDKINDYSRRSGPLKLCTFSRVVENKGIEDAIDAVTAINKKHGDTKYTLDIYGQVDPIYFDKFEALRQSFPDFISYKGVIDFSKTTSVLEKYYMLVFPTRFQTEGVPGTIIDAFSAGLPVIASEWESFADIITEGVTGYGYKINDQKALESLLEKSIDDPLVETMRINCIEQVVKYLPDLALKPLYEMIAEE